MITKRKFLVGLPLVLMALLFASCSETCDVYTTSFYCQNDLQDSLAYTSGYSWNSVEPSGTGRLWSNATCWVGDYTPDWDYFLDIYQKGPKYTALLLRYKGQIYLDVEQNEKSVLNPYAFSFDRDTSIAMSDHCDKWTEKEAFYIFRIDEDYLNSLIKIDSNADVESVMASYLE